MAMKSVPHGRIRLFALGAFCSLANIAAHADDLTVSAAASLSNAFGELGKAYEAKHPGDKVVLNFAASDVLLKQIDQGAHCRQHARTVGHEGRHSGVSRFPAR